MESITARTNVDLKACRTLNELARQIFDVYENYTKEDADKVWNQILDRSTRPVTEAEFFKEYVWAVSVSGFSARVVTNRFTELMQAHGLWDDEGEFIPQVQATEDVDLRMEKVFAVWKSHAKFRAITDVRHLSARLTWPVFHQKFLETKTPQKISGLAFMGPALSCHLARNIGNKDIVKPDIHLNRLAKQHGYSSAAMLCKSIRDVRFLPHAEWPLGRIDLVTFYAAASK